MCFSATASFVSSGVLLTAGAASLMMAKKNERLLAAMPVLFAAQQTVEGLQWLMPHPSLSSQILAYLYVVFAFLLWPIYFPLAIYQLEPKPIRKTVIRWLLGLGIFVTLGEMITLTLYPLSTTIDGHVLYTLPVSEPITLLGLALYTIAAVGSTMASSLRSVKLFGLAFFVAEVVTIYLYWTHFTSVWCFFASVLSASIAIGFYIRAKKRKSV